MSKKWWVLTGLSLLAAAGLFTLGLEFFSDEGLWEGTLVEGVGLFAAFAVAILLIEGPLLTRQSLTDSLNEYKQYVFRKIWEEIREETLAIATELSSDPESVRAIQGEENASWSDMTADLEELFRHAQAIGQEDLKEVMGLDEQKAHLIAESCLGAIREVREAIRSKPEFEQWYVLGKVETKLVDVERTINEYKDGEDFRDPIVRHQRVGRIGDEMLGLVSNYGSAFGAVSVL